MAGGLGTRMRSSTPKHLHPLLGRRVVDWVIDSARGAGADPVVVGVFAVIALILILGERGERPGRT